MNNRTLLLLSSLILVYSGVAQNPIIQTVYTADPAPLVNKDTLYLFTGHEDSATSKGFIRDDYLCFSTTDMVNWTHHGPVFSTAYLGCFTQSWSGNYKGDGPEPYSAVCKSGKHYTLWPKSSVCGGKKLGRT